MNETQDTFDDRPGADAHQADPALDALLDEALAVRDIPEGLEHRVLAEVRAAKPMNGQPGAPVQTKPTDPAGSPVLGRIGFGVAWAAAAVLALGTVLVAIWGTDRGNESETVQVPPINAETQLAALETALAELETYAADARQPDTLLDDQIALLDTQLALTASETLWLEGDAWESVEIAATQSDLDALAFPLDATF